MRLLCTASLLSTLFLTSCSPFSGTGTSAPPVVVNDLAVKHVYKIPKKKVITDVHRFHDPQLNQLITIALLDAPTMQSAQARLERAMQLAKGAQSVLWPAANLNGYVQKQYFPLSGVVPPPLNEVNVTTVSIESIATKFNYELDLWGKNKQALASKISETLAACMDVAQTRLLLSAAVATAYFDLQNNKIQLKLAQENLHLQRQLSAIIKDREKQGIESNIPVKTALSNTQVAASVVEASKRVLRQSQHQLAVLLGKNPFNTEIATMGYQYQAKQLILPKVIPANLLAQRPDIVAARALAEAAAHQISVAKAAFYPNINLTGILSYQSFYFSNFFNVRFQNNGATAALDLPIFDAGARKANLGVSYANYNLAVSQYNQTILNALKDVTDQMTALTTLNKQASEQSMAVNTTESNYNLIKSRYTHGIIDFTQVIEVQQILVQQKAVLYSLQTQQKQAFVALLAALGGEV